MARETSELLIRPAVKSAVARHFSQKSILELATKLTQAERLITQNGNRRLSILITDDREIRKLNRQYRHKDKSTDVLSFPVKDDSPLTHQSLGDLVISWNTTVRQAREYSSTVREEFVRLLIHGFLHLCGYDHENVTPREVRRMQKREAALSKKLNPNLRGKS